VTNTFKSEVDKHLQGSAKNLHDLKVMAHECNQKIMKHVMSRAQIVTSFFLIIAARGRSGRTR